MTTSNPLSLKKNVSLKVSGLFAAILTLTFTLPVVYAEQKVSLDFSNMETTINQSPWESYQQLVAYQKENHSIPNQTYIWLLFRKAQAENLLYFYDDFEVTVKMALQLLTKDSPIELKGMLHIYSGLAERRNGRYQKAIAAFKHSMSIFQTEKLNPVYILAKLELAYSHSLIGVYQAALDELVDSYALAIQLDNPYVIALAYETYGAIYGYLDKHEESISYYQKALKGYQDLGYLPYQAEAIYGIATTYRYWGEYDLAIEYFEKYIDKVSYIPNDSVKYYGNYGLGMTNAEKGNCVHAIEIIDKALSQTGKADYDSELYKKKASCLIKLNKYDEAEKALTEARLVFSTLADLIGTSWELETIKIEGELAFARGELEKAYTITNDYHNKNAELMSKDSADRLTILRSTYEIKRKDAQIELLQQQAQLQSLKSEKHFQDTIFQRYLLGFAVILIIISLAAFALQRRHTKKIVALSIRDSLSGLYNRRYTFQLLNKLLKSLSDNKNNLSIIILDVDNFKQINDQYGHPFGDQVIRMIAEICQSTLRADDVMGRIGGEEFLCVLPRTDSESCKQIAQRMSYQISKYSFCDEHKKPFNVTISTGITSTSSKNISTDALFLQADKALYHSKHSGKNQVTYFFDIND